MFRSLGLAVEDLAAAQVAVATATGAGHRHGGRTVIELAEIEAARERIAGAAVRTPLVRLHVEGARPRSTSSWRTCSRSTRSRSAARPTRCCPPRRGARAGGLVTASAGNMAQGVAWVARELGPARHDRGARARAAGQARRHRTARRAGAQAALRRLVAGDRRPAGSTGSRGCSCTRSQDPGVMAGQRHHRAGGPRGPARPGRGRDPLRRRRADGRHRQRGQGAAAGHADLHR